MKEPVTRGERVRLEILRGADGGRGVAVVNGLTVLVEQTLPGECVEAEIEQVHPRYALARPLRVVTPSPERAEPSCPHYGKCGGCCMQHMTYPSHLRALEEQVSSLLQRVGGYAPGEYELLPIGTPKSPWHLRNKAVYRAGGTDREPILGFVGRGSHETVPAEGCLLQTEQANLAARVTQEWMRHYSVTPCGENSPNGVLRHLMVRTNKKGETLVCPVTACGELPHARELTAALREALPGLRGVVQNINPREGGEILGRKCRLLYGEERLEDELMGRRFRLSPLSFYQVNRELTEDLYAQTLSFAALRGGEEVADAYCGAGTISLCLAGAAKRVVGIEIVEAAVRDARENAARNGVTNAEFRCGACEEVLPRMVREGRKMEVVVLDPPRKGCEESVLCAAAQAGPERMVYVSCNPATLARDAARLKKLGYVLRKARPFDMFSWTGEVETAALFERERSIL